MFHRGQHAFVRRTFAMSSRQIQPPAPPPFVAPERMLRGREWSADRDGEASASPASSTHPAPAR